MTDRSTGHSREPGICKPGRCLVLLWLVYMFIVFLGSGCTTTPETGKFVDTSQAIQASCAERKKEIEPLAEGGDANAQLEMGGWFTSICGDYDKAKGAEWYQQSAGQGNQDAMYRIANMYFYGTGIEKDIEQADKWYRNAAEQGEEASIRRLGSMYLEGNGVKKNLDEAEKWQGPSNTAESLSKFPGENTLVR